MQPSSSLTPGSDLSPRVGECVPVSRVSVPRVPVCVLVPPIIEGVPWAQDCGDTVVSETLAVCRFRARRLFRRLQSLRSLISSVAVGISSQLNHAVSRSVRRLWLRALPGTARTNQASRCANGLH